MIAQSVRVNGDLARLRRNNWRLHVRRCENRRCALRIPRHAALIDGIAEAPTAGNARLLAIYDEVCRDLGFGELTAINHAMRRAEYLHTEQVDMASTDRHAGSADTWSTKSPI